MTDRDTKEYAPLALQPAGLLGPLLDVGPVPGGPTAHGPSGLREAELAVSPLVEGAAGDAEAFADLDDADGVTFHGITVSKVLTDVKGCEQNTYMTHSNFADTINYSIEQVWGGPCDHHNCKGDCVAFISINFSDGGSVGGYLCRTHLNQYEVAYGLPRTDGVPTGRTGEDGLDAERDHMGGAVPVGARPPIKYGKDVEVGDVILFFGTPHRVATLEEYVHPIVTEGETWQIARASDGWGISLAPLTRVEVA